MPRWINDWGVGILFLLTGSIFLWLGFFGIRYRAHTTTPMAEWVVLAVVGGVFLLGGFAVLLVN